MDTPQIRPACPNFSSGPCAKRPGYAPGKLDVRALGRSHRSALGKELLARACAQTARLLALPEGWRVGIVPASDTGAIEMAMWSMLGARGVDMFAWDAFGKDWAKDVTEQLKLSDVRVFDAPYGALPDLAQYDGARDAVFTWNGTTSGVCVPNADWIADAREGLVFCDATSAVFSMALPWEKLDVVTFSWQKALGGEGAHGVLLLSPSAVQRLESYTPPWPLPKIFRLTSGGKLAEGIFRGETINTPSMLCVLDYLDALEWAEELGGVPALCARSQESARHIADFVAQHGWIDFLAQDEAARSCTSVCLKVDLPAEKIKQMQKLLEREGVAYDIGSYKSAPVGLRVWCGATVEPADVRALMPWLAWAYEKVR